jgi:hypothetical protein
VGVTSDDIAYSSGTDVHRAGPNRAQLRAAERRVVRNRKVYVLTFEDPDLAGIEIRARSVSLGRYLELIKLAAVIDDPTKMGEEGALAIEGLFHGFAEALVEWNIDDEAEQPIPATLEGILAEDVDFMLQVIQVWMEVIGDVSGPLGSTSNGGKPSLEAGIPMQVATSPNPST